MAKVLFFGLVAGCIGGPTCRPYFSTLLSLGRWLGGSQGKEALSI